MAASGAPERPDLFVIARILDRLWREGNPMLRTHLQAGTNLNYDLLRKYVDWLAARQLVRVETGEDGKERVSVTPQGVEAYRRLADWIREFVQGPHRR